MVSNVITSNTRDLFRSESGVENTKIKFIHLLVFMALFLPLSLTINSDGTKPMDFLVTDIILIFWLPSIFIGRFPKSLHLIFWGFLFISLFSIFYNAISEDFLLQRIISFVRMFRSFIFIFIGYRIATKYEIETIFLICCKISFAMVLILFLSDIFLTENFPVVRWGGNFFGIAVYGFPNSASAFYSVFSLFLAAALLGRERSKKFRIIYGTALLINIVTITMSLSRSALGTLVILLILLFIFGIHKRFFAIISVIIIASIIYVVFLNYPDLFSAFWFKVDRTLYSDDFSSGRTEIWTKAFDLIMERPLLGYGYQYFSNYSDYDTPHNQYLELIYKSGILGGGTFVVILLYAVWKGLISKTVLHRQFACLIFAWSISCFFQPNFSYSQTLNFTMFMIGMLVVRRHNPTVMVKRQL